MFGLSRADMCEVGLANKCDIKKTCKLLFMDVVPQNCC